MGGPISTDLAKHYRHTITGNLGLDTPIFGRVANLGAKDTFVTFYDRGAAMRKDRTRHASARLERYAWSAILKYSVRRPIRCAP